MRTGFAIVLTAVLVGSLAACSSGGSDAAACTPTKSGTASDAVKVAGDFGSKPDVTIDSPVSVDVTERTVVTEGEGRKAATGDVATVDFTLYNADTGEELTGTDYTEGSEAQFTVDETQFLPGIVKTIECSTAGSRIVGVIPPADSWGDAGSTDLGVTADQSIVLVIDVVKVEAAPDPGPTKADGEDQPAEDGFPTVTLADDGTPTVTIPDTAPPTDLKISVLKKGDGDVVADGDTVTVQYQGLNWTTKEIFDQSWGTGSTASFATTQVITGFGQAMVGQTVGSQVIVIIPPDLGYGPQGGNSDAGISATDTLVFVIDILGTVPAS